MSMSAADRSEEADAWVARMDRGDWSETDEAALRAWLAHDPRHAGALLHAQAAWAATDLSAVAAGAVPEAPAEPYPGPPMRRRALGRIFGGAVAAAAAVWLLWPAGGTSYATGVGEVRRVPLADGTIATINTATDIEFRVAANERDMQLRTGEAWFEVAKDPARPFVVAAGRVRIRAVGTAFSVRRRGDGADIMVTEGVVEAWVEGSRAAPVRMKAGYRARLAADGAIEPEAVGPVSADRILAWRSGKIELVGNRLDEAAAEFNRYNRRQIVLVDRRLNHEQFDGVFRVDDPQAFAGTVGAALDVPVDLSDPATIRVGAVIKP